MQILLVKSKSKSVESVFPPNSSQQEEGPSLKGGLGITMAAFVRAS